MIKGKTGINVSVSLMSLIAFVYNEIEEEGTVQ